MIHITPKHRRHGGRAAVLILAFVASAIGSEHLAPQAGAAGHAAGAYARAARPVGLAAAGGGLGVAGFRRGRNRRGPAHWPGEPRRTFARAQGPSPAFERPIDAFGATRPTAYSAPPPASDLLQLASLSDINSNPVFGTFPGEPGPGAIPPTAPVSPPGEAVCCAQNPTPPPVSPPTSPTSPPVSPPSSPSPPLAGIPEPATWAVMLLGLGAIGVALRSRVASGGSALGRTAQARLP